MNPATYTRALAAVFLGVHRSALTRVAVAADKAEAKALAHLEAGRDQRAVIELALVEAKADVAARNRDLTLQMARADSINEAVQQEIALLPFIAKD